MLLFEWLERNVQKDHGYVFNTHSLNRPDAKTKPIPTQKRRLEKAAVRIQSKWRAYQDLKRCRSKIRKDWDRKMGDLEKLVLMLESRGMSFSPPANTVFELLREFNFFDTSNRVSSTMTYDLDRVRKMCELVRKSMMSSVKNQNILALSQKSSSFSWKTQARHFILRLFPALLYVLCSSAKRENFNNFSFSRFYHVTQMTRISLVHTASI